MQMNLVAQLSAAPPSQPANSNDAPQEKNDRFAKMLSDADARGSNEQKQPRLKSNDTSASAVSAQEMNSEQSAAVVAAPTAESKVLATVVSPEDAKAMLAKLEEMNANGEHSNDPAFQQLKEALEQIEAGTEPTDVGSMLEVLPEVADALPEEREPVLQRLMGWVSAAIDKQKEAPAATMPDSTVQSLQASLFPAGDDAARAAAEAAAQAAAESKKRHAAEATAAITVIVPTAQNGTMPEWVRKLGEGEENLVTEAINDAIPALTLDEGEEGLPVVDLPGSEDLAGAKAGKKGPLNDFDALVKHAPLSLHDAVEEKIEAPIVAADPTTTTALSNAPSVHNTSTLNPITLSVQSHLTPHRAAAEQVNVAITTMKDEGVNSITLQLEPADLGRVEIKMDTVEGKTNIAFLVDKPETLDSLARDARSLERMLQEAGVRADAGSMQFNLRQQAQEQAADDSNGGKRGNGDADGSEEISALEGAVTKHYTLNVKDGVDIHA